MSFDLASAWGAARRMLARALALTGAASAFAKRAVLAARERRAILAWLTNAEALARKLILIEVRQIQARDVTAPAPSIENKAAPQSVSRACAAHRDENWRAPFRLNPRAASVGAHAKTTAPQGPRAPAALALARRIEALQRVLADPQALIRRAARRLRDLAPLAAALLSHPPRADLSDGEHDAATRALWFALAAPAPNSS